MSFNCQFTTKMILFSKSCICQSAKKKFLMVAFENMQNFFSTCGMDSEIAINLETPDYEALGFCQPPVIDQYYSIGLRLPDVSAKRRRICNSSSHPYFWRNRTSEVKECVDGSPLDLPRNFEKDRRCHLASVSPGSLDQIYNATWTRCNSVQYAVCQSERNASISSVCKNVSTRTATLTTTTTTALSNNSTAIIIGSVSGVFIILFFVLMRLFFQKKNKTKRNVSNQQNHKKAVQK